MNYAVKFANESMAGCTDTNRYDCEAIAKANYRAYKTFIDHQWNSYLSTWSSDAYMNAGLFYSCTYTALTTSSIYYVNRPIL